MIWIIYEKEDKKTALQIIETLKLKGFEAQLSQSPQSIVSDSSKKNVAVFLISPKSIENDLVKKSYETAFNSNVPMIQMLIKPITDNLPVKHFLNTHDWIDATEVNLNVATEALFELLKSNLPIDVKKSDVKPNRKNLIILGTLAIIILVAFFIIFGNKNKEKKILNNVSADEQLLVGDWYLADYSDNVPRKTNDSIEYAKLISNLKINFLLKLNSDKSFEKYGFSTPETGNWQYDPQNLYLYMWPEGQELTKDKLKIEKLTNDSLIFVIASMLDSVTLVNTKFTLIKHKNTLQNE